MVEQKMTDMIHIDKQIEMMDVAEVMQLLDRYYEGLTSLDEEQTLKEYFAQENVPSELESDRQVFAAMQSHASVEIEEKALAQYPSSLDDKLNAMMKRFSEEEQFDADPAQRLVVSSPHITDEPPRRHLKRWFSWIEVAAACAVLVLSVSTFNRTQEPAEFMLADTCKTPDEAAAYLHEAMTLMTTHLQAGLQQVDNAIDENQQIQQDILLSLQY